MALTKHESDCKICDVVDCDKESERSLSMKQVSKSSLKFKGGDLKNVHLCKDHYRTFKKETKKTRELDQVY